jgi:DNA-binding NtrC family response regulator
MGDTILVVDDQPEVREYILKVLSKRGFEILEEADGEGGLRRLRELSARISLVILDLDLGHGRDEGLKVLESMKKDVPEVPVIILTGKGTTETAVKAMKLGAEDYLEKDTYIEESLKASMEKVRRLLRVVDENKRLRRKCQGLKREADLYMSMIRNRYRIVGQSEPFRKILEKARSLASIPRPVLIRGERGTGKELVAAAIHYEGNRASKPFVKVNCAAFHGDLLESEMFGHEKGAFTGSDSRKIGRFELAHGGTLFLDEIGNMSLDFQQKILRVIEYQEFERVGGTDVVRVNVRVIAATNADLETMMAEGRFREDLYDRLTFETIQIPPLRERRDDIPLLVDSFSQSIVEEVAGLEPKAFTDRAIRVLTRYPWPGNVRQLKYVVERLICSVPSDTIDLIHLPSEITEEERPPAETFPDKVAEFERGLIVQALGESNHNQKRAAQLLGLSYDQFRHYYRKYGIKKAMQAGDS